MSSAGAAPGAGAAPRDGLRLPRDGPPGPRGDAPSPEAAEPGRDLLALLAQLEDSHTKPLMEADWTVLSPRLGPGGAALVAAALRRNTILRSLDLGWNSVDAAGAASLAGVLEVNDRLQRMSLCGNPVADAGAASLAEALGRNTALHTLDLRECGLGDPGIDALVAALRGRNSTLTFLDVSENPGISGATLEVLKAAHTWTACTIRI